MEGSETQAIFNSLNLDPQLFINETLNTVDDLVDDAFNFYRQEALARLKIEGTDRFQDLSEGIDHVRNTVQSVIDNRLGMWEKYSLSHCFAVPEGFTLPNTREILDDSSTWEDPLHDPDLDSQLESIREKLTLERKKSIELNSELKALERQSAASNHCTALVHEALQLYERDSLHDMFQEMVNTASELYVRMEKLKTRRMEGIEHTTIEMILNPSEDLCRQHLDKDLKLEDPQECVTELKKM